MRFVFPFLVAFCISALQCKTGHFALQCFGLVHADRAERLAELVLYESHHHGKSVMFAAILHPEKYVICIWSICSLNAVADKGWLLFCLKLCHVRACAVETLCSCVLLLCVAAGYGSCSNKLWSCTALVGILRAQAATLPKAFA